MGWREAAREGMGVSVGGASVSGVRVTVSRLRF